MAKVPQRAAATAAPASGRVVGSSRRGRRGLAIVAALLLAVGACSSGADDSGPAGGTTTGSTAPCPTTVGAELAAPEELRRLLGELNAFGLRSPASDADNAAVDWLAEQFRAVPGMRIEWDEYTIDRWQPTTEAPGDVPGRDLAAAGGLTVAGGANPEQPIPLVGAVPFTLPTGDAGVTAPLVRLAPGQAMTAANVGGRIVVTDIPRNPIPYNVFRAIGHHVTDDVPRDGDYDRPYTRDLDKLLVDAGRAGAAGVVMVWDAPTDQLRGYWDPHSGTRYAVPAVYAGSDQLAGLESLAATGSSARLVVRAAWDRAPARNLIATLPGRTRERIVLNTNSDSVNWVQENGPIGLLALARYLGGLPEACRARDVQFALTANHLGFTTDGTFRYAPQLDRDMDAGTVAFVMALEHLGAREVLPGPDGRLAFTGDDDIFAWSAPDESPVLVKASVEAAQRRKLERTVVVRGVAAPGEHVPVICSQGGLGTNFHWLLIPTIAGISGPWTLWAPEFGSGAVDVGRMRDQLLAFGDIALALDDVPRDEIAGGYLEARRRRAAGAATCDLKAPAAVAPGPDAPAPPGG